MKATYESNGVVYNREQISDTDIDVWVKNLDGWSNPYLILENNDGDYMQCMGGHDGFVVEVRFYDGEKFKHFVLGNNEMSTVWNEVTGKVGPVRVLDHEVLKRSDVDKLLKSFFTTGEVESTYNKRNITKTFARTWMSQYLARYIDFGSKRKSCTSIPAKRGRATGASGRAVRGIAKAGLQHSCGTAAASFRHR